MTTKYFSECALLLTERWGSLFAPLYAVGATSKEIGCFAQCVKNPDAVFMFETKLRLHHLAEKALSLPHYSPSDMVQMMSSPYLRVSMDWAMVCEAYGRKYDDGTGKRTLQAPSLQWIRNLIATDAAKAGQKYPLLCSVFHELFESLSTDSPSPTPAIGAENAPKTAISIHPYRNGVVLALLFFFGLTANAQVQPKPGKWVSAHIAHVGEIVDTIRQAVTVSRWYTNCRDCDSFCVITNPVGQKCLWKVDQGRTMNGTQPVEWRNGAWWYSVAPGSGQRWEVELLFEPVKH